MSKRSGMLSQGSQAAKHLICNQFVLAQDSDTFIYITNVPGPAEELPKMYGGSGYDWLTDSKWTFC